jgi:general secretion pathway protein I
LFKTQHQHQAKDGRPQGFTLLEVMVAMSIIAIVLVSVFTMQAQTASMSTETQFQATAPLLAQQKMTEMATSLSEQPEEASGDFGEEFIAYRWQSSVEAVESENFGAVSKDIKKISVTISLNEGEQAVTFTAYRLAID